MSVQSSLHLASSQFSFLCVCVGGCSRGAEEKDWSLSQAPVWRLTPMLGSVLLVSPISFSSIPRHTHGLNFTHHVLLTSDLKDKPGHALTTGIMTKLYRDWATDHWKILPLLYCILIASVLLSLMCCHKKSILYVCNRGAFEQYCYHLHQFSL